MLFVKEMDNNFYRDDFEEMLKDTTEDFRMYPSRKVWHSIYNDLHPDRKWPSFAVSLLLLTAILYVGVSNNNNISRTTVPLIVSELSGSLQSATQVPGKLPTNTSPTAKITSKQPQQNKQVVLSDGQESTREHASRLSKSPAIGSLQTPTTLYAVAGTNSASLKTATTDGAEKVTKSIYASEEKIVSLNSIPFVAELAPVYPVNTAEKSSLDNTVTSNKNAGDSPIITAEISATEDLSSINSTDESVATTQRSEKSLLQAEKSWMEDFAFHNLRNPNKWKTNVSFQYYITPSIGYRHLNKNNGKQQMNGSLIATHENDELTQQAAPNFEAGAVLILGISKRLKVKSGLQFNLTNYNTYAHDLQHPTQTTVPMNDPTSGYLHHDTYNTTYGNVLGSNFTKLNNQTFQLSIPIGIDYRVAGNDRMTWYMGAGIQPAYIVSGNAYLISSDSKNYVKDNAMLRKWNASANLETFVSIKTPSGIHLNVGPQFRYQLLSTYSKRYSYTEKLYNVGIKIGVTKKL